MKRFIGVLTAFFIHFSFSVPMFVLAQTQEDRNEVAVVAQEGGFDQEIKDLANKTMRMIYDNILAGKQHYESLRNFDESVLSMNQYGIYSIQYASEVFAQNGQKLSLEFGLTVVGMDDTYFDGHHRDAFNLGFPLLGFKFIGYQKRNRERKQFDIHETINNNSSLFLEEQNRRLPLKLSLATAKEVYKVGEKVDVTVTLENVSNKIFWITDLNETTLYLILGDAKWGTARPVKNKNIPKIKLKPGAKVYKKIMGSGFSFPQEVEIYCSYGTTFKGVKPYSVLKIEIIP
jgi:hypothetical protein